MSTLRTKTEYYVWDRKGTTPIKGAMIRRLDDRAFCFLPMDQILEVANQLVDILEQHEKENA
jgi:predicted RNA-binding protein with EMAP domain